MTQSLRAFARVGAELELKRLEAERDAILRAFPELKGVRKSVQVRRRVRRPVRKISKALRAKMNAGIKRYWANKRKEQKATAA